MPRQPPRSRTVSMPQAPSGDRTTWDASIAGLAARQHGVVSREQLREAGLTTGGIRHRVEHQRLHPIYPGVFAVGHRVLSARGWWMAAVLAGGPGALLCRRAAAALWGLVDGAPTVADVLVLRTVEPRRGLRPHRTVHVADEDRAEVNGIPCTSVARTLLDLAPTTDARGLDRALRRAEDLHLFDRFALDAVLGRSRPGTAALRSAMRVFAGDAAECRRLKGELELRFLELLRAHDFVLPRTNVTIATPWRDWEVDTLWPAERRVIELDGWWTHRDRESFRRDHERAMDVRAAGFDVMRLTWDQVVVQQRLTVEKLRRILPRAATTGTVVGQRV